MWGLGLPIIILGYERVYLPLCKVADTPFHSIQGDDILFSNGDERVLNTRMVSRWLIAGHNKNHNLWAAQQPRWYFLNQAAITIHQTIWYALKYIHQLALITCFKRWVSVIYQLEWRQVQVHVKWLFIQKIWSILDTTDIQELNSSFQINWCMVKNKYNHNICKTKYYLLLLWMRI